MTTPALNLPDLREEIGLPMSPFDSHSTAWPSQLAFWNLTSELRKMASHQAFRPQALVSMLWGTLG